jgi:hypothetical protein
MLIALPDGSLPLSSLYPLARRRVQLCPDATLIMRLIIELAVCNHPFEISSGWLRSCLKKHCSKFCKARFQYSDGCGNSIESANVWVQSPLGVNQCTWKVGELQASAVQDPNTWTVLTQGTCQFCTPCSAGYYNDACNQYYELGSPQGECKQCKSQCPVGQFMWHPDQDAGCHEPPKSHNATDNSGQFQILHDYTCVPCPKWVRQGANLSVVAACGLHGANDKYVHFSSDIQKNEVQTTQKAVVEEANGNEKIDGVERRNFRTFIKNLKPYCPPMFFFNSGILGCDLINEGEVFDCLARYKCALATTIKTRDAASHANFVMLRSRERT